MKQDEELAETSLLPLDPPSPSWRPTPCTPGSPLRPGAAAARQAVATHRSITGDDPLVLSDSWTISGICSPGGGIRCGREGHREAIRVESAAPNDPATSGARNDLYGLVPAGREGHHADAERPAQCTAPAAGALWRSQFGHRARSGPGPCRGDGGNLNAAIPLIAAPSPAQTARPRAPPGCAEAVNDWRC